MKRLVLLTAIAACCSLTYYAQAQSLEFSTFIVATDTITDEGVTFAASSDDAEQENDAMDALFDDDIDAGWEGAPEDQNILTAGMRFQGIRIPQGATIDSAFIVVHSHEAKTAEDVARLTIYGDNTDDAQTFTEDQLITDRPSTNAQVDWTVDEPWGLWTPHRTPDLSAIVQELVDRDGWRFGNSIAFVFAGEDQGPSEVENAREWMSFENIEDPEDGGDGQNKPERRPRLFIYFTAESIEVQIPIVATDTITDEGVTFEASSDDAEQENDAIDALFDDDIDAGWEGAPEDQNILTAGMRFQNIPVPQGSRIDSAFIVVHSHEAKTAEDVARLTIYGDNTDDAETFTEDQLIDARPSTDAQVEWTVDEPWGLWTPHRTPDLTPIVQELVNRDGWKAGNSIAFVFLGEDQGPSEVENAREWMSFENIEDPEDGGDGQNKPERRPRLFIYYSIDQAVSTQEVFTASIEPLKVFPNPAQGQVTVELETEAPAFIRVFNGNGQLMRELKSDFGKQQQIDISGLNAGIYYIQAQQDDQLYLQKLVVE